MAPRHGFEPRFTAPKAAVLPLDDRGKQMWEALAPTQAPPSSVSQDLPPKWPHERKNWTGRRVVLRYAGSNASRGTANKRAIRGFLPAWPSRPLSSGYPPLTTAACAMRPLQSPLHPITILDHSRNVEPRNDRLRHRVSRNYSFKINIRIFVGDICFITEWDMGFCYDFVTVLFSCGYTHSIAIRNGTDCV